jgi:hypothetical protein
MPVDAPVAVHNLVDQKQFNPKQTTRANNPHERALLSVPVELKKLCRLK